MKLHNPDGSYFVFDSVEDYQMYLSAKNGDSAPPPPPPAPEPPIRVLPPPPVPEEPKVTVGGRTVPRVFFMTAKEENLLNALVDAYPNPLTVPEVADAVKAKHPELAKNTGGAFDTLFSKIRNRFIDFGIDMIVKQSHYRYVLNLEVYSETPIKITRRPTTDQRKWDADNGYRAKV